MEAIKKYLGASAIGREAVAYFEEKVKEIKLNSSRGCAWNGTYVIIDRNFNLQLAALSFVHEVYHARADKEGKSGDTKRQSREEYLDTMFNEEVQATIAAIKARVELTAAGVPPDLRCLPPQDFEYHKACRAARLQLLERSPDASPAEQKAAAEDGGYKFLLARYVSGEARGSRDGRPYTEIYGSAWDDAHAPKRPR